MPTAVERMIIPVVIGTDDLRLMVQFHAHWNVVNTFLQTVLRDPDKSTGVIRSRWL